MCHSLTAALPLIAAAVLAAALPVGAGTGAEVAVTACGQLVPDRTLGYLTADLDCTGFTGAPGNVYGQAIGAAVYLGKKSKLDLRGFTITAGRSGVYCDALICGDLGQPCSRGPCEIFNGTIVGAASDVAIGGNKPVVHDVIIDGSGGFNFGIDARSKATVTNVGVSGCADTGIRGYGGPNGFHRMKILGSTITGNDRYGVEMIGNGLVIQSSTVTGNGTLPECSTGLSCADLLSAKRPKLDMTTCDTSGGSPSGSWGVCALD